MRSLAVLSAALASACLDAGAADWSQWRGPERDGVCTETGLLKQWPEGGPPLLWRRGGLGSGYSTVAIAGGQLLTMGDRRARDGRNGQFVIAFDLATREELWAARVGPPNSDGPRCTPTIDGPLAYAIGTGGDLVCVEAATGKERWRKHFEADFGGRMSTMWKYSESPLVDGDKLLCTPGAQDAMVVALNKTTGETIWKCAVPDLGPRGRPGAAYSSIVVAETGGLRQYVQLVGEGLIGVRASDGKLLWSYNRIANAVANVPTPVVSGNHVFCTTAYGTGAALLELSRTADGVTAREVYFLSPDVFENIHGGVVLVGGYIYGGKGHKGNHVPICIEFLTGRVAWEAPRALGRLSCAALYADGCIYLRYEDDTMALVEATPDAFRLKGLWKPHSRGRGPAWAHPVIFGGKLYLRHGDELACYDLEAR